MATRAATFIITVVFCITFSVKQKSFVSCDTIGLSIVGSEIEGRNNFYMSSLWIFYKGKHTNFRLRYSKNGICCLLLLLCGDIHPCPGPVQPELETISKLRGVKILHQNVRNLFTNLIHISKSIFLRSQKPTHQVKLQSMFLQ